MKFRIFNVNYHVWVKLNHIGIAMWRDEHNKYAPPDYPFEEHYARKTKDGYTEFQMHEFMSLFGGEMSPTFDTPFDMNILIDENELK